MRLFKKITSFILLLSLIAGYIPPAAAESSPKPTANTAATLQGENTVGEILADDISEAQQEQYAAQDGSAITDVTVSAQSATVSYSLQQEAVIVVAIYSQDGTELLTDSKITCAPGDGVAELTFPDQLPAYFYISAFILDPVSNKPLCSAYRNPMYTQSMQELLNATVDDYDPELVLNLDESRDTNFLVFSESTKEITQKENTNIVRSADEESCTYIIDNTDKQFTGLKAGDIVRYPYGENEMLIVKVSTVSVSGTTVTLTGQKPEAEEVFQAVKIESSADPEDVAFDETSCGDGLTYIGSGPATRASGTEDFSFSHPFEVNKEISKGPVTLSAKGKLEISLGITVNYYLTFFDQYIKLDNNLGVSAELTLSDKLEWAPEKLQFSASFLGIFSAGIELGFSIGAEIEGKFTASFTQTISFVYDNGDYRNSSTKPVFDTDADISASIKLGISVGINLQLLSGLAKVGLSAGLEFAVKAVLEDGPAETNGRIHYCDLCLGVSIDLTFKMWVDLGLVWDLIDKDYTFLELPWHICDFYHSFDTKEGGLGTCPNKAPQLIIWSEPYTDLEITVLANTQTAKTNLLGFASVYVTAGPVSISASKENRRGYASLDVTESTAVTVQLSYQGYIGDVHWHLDSIGILTLTGITDNAAVSFPDGTKPWDDLSIPIKTINFINCAVADNAFAGQTDLCAVSLRNCTVGANAFKGCDQLTSLSLYGTVTVGDSAFESCAGLCAVSFNNATACTLGQRAFANCTALNRLTLSCPELTFGKDAFLGCTGLSAVYVNHLNTWLNFRFANADANPLYNAGQLYVRNILLTTLSTDDAIPDYAFAGCTGLRRIEFSDKLTAIGAGAFTNCTALADIYFYGNPPSIADNAFTGVTATAYHIDYDETWQDSHRISYGGNLTWDTIGKPIASGKYSGIAWRMHDDGFLLIFDNNESPEAQVIPDFEAGKTPWSKYADMVTCILIDEGIAKIGNNSFRSFIKLTDVQLPSTLISIGEEAFAYCTALTQLKLPTRLQTLGSRCFMRTNLQWIDIPATIKVIGDGSLSTSCNTIINITDIATWCNLSFGTAPLYNNTLYLNGAPISTLTIPDSVTAIPDYAFSYLNAEQVVLGANVVSVGRYAFRYSTITGISLNYALTTIGEGAFASCSLQNITIPENVTSVGDTIFYDCRDLRTVTYNASAPIPSLVFSNCTALTEVTIGNNVSAISNAFHSCIALERVNFGTGLTHIGPKAFENCPALTTLDFPESLNKIWTNSFVNLPNLKTITFHSPNAPLIYGYYYDYSLPAYIFQGCTASVNYPRTGTWLDSDSWTYFGENLSCHGYVPGTASSSGGSSSQEVQVRTEQFTELIPGQEYLYISVIDPEASDLLDYSNLLYIDQYVADESGAIVCSYQAYADTVTGHGLIFGGGRLRISDAQVTFPEMTISSEPALVTPTVILGEQTLAEGKDYTLTGDLVYSKVGYYCCTIRGINDYCDSITCTYAVKHPALELVTTDDVNACFENLNAAISACDTTTFVRLTADHAENITVTADAQLDLNGCTLTGDVTVGNGATLYVVDSATADFTADSRGKLIGTVTGDLARTALTPADAYGASYKYLTLLEAEDTYSFHRIYLSVHSAVLTPYRDYGDYIGTDLNYKAAFKCNDLVAQHVTAYGADITVDKTVSLDFLSRPIEPGADSMNERKTTLRGTLRSTNLSFQNADNAAKAPLVQLYIRLDDGLQEQVSARPVELSLRDVLEQLCRSTDYTAAQKTALANMYNTHKVLMDTWGTSMDTLRFFAKYFGYNATVTWVSPLSSCTLTSPFGYRVQPVYGTTVFHNGVDLSTAAGTPIYAVRSGTVTKASYDSSSGNHVYIDHGDGYSSHYLHMTHYVVSPGQYVEQGQVIGYVGSTGTSTGPHLHLSILYANQYQHPLTYITLPD